MDVFEIVFFRFDVDGAIIKKAAGGDASLAGFNLKVSKKIPRHEERGIVQGSSITGTAPNNKNYIIPTGGCGVLVELTLDGDATGLSDIKISNDKRKIPFQYYSPDSNKILSD